VPDGATNFRNPSSSPWTLHPTGWGQLPVPDTARHLLVAFLFFKQPKKQSQGGEKAAFLLIVSLFGSAPEGDGEGLIFLL